MRAAGRLVTLALKELQRRPCKTVKVGALASLSSLEKPRPAVVPAKVTARSCARPRWDYTGCSLSCPGRAAFLPSVRATAIDSRRPQDLGLSHGLSTSKVTCE